MMLSILSLETYPTWALIVAGAAMLFGLAIGVRVFIAYCRRNKRIGTRSYEFPATRGGCRGRRRATRGWRFWPFSIVLLAVLLGGCMERAVIVPPTVPVRLAEQLHGVSVWVKDTNGKEVKARADLFPGMIIATDPKDFPTVTRARFMNLRRDQ